MTHNSQPTTRNILPLGVLAALTLAVAARAEVSVETVRWQGEIDRVAAAGGGTVRMPEGRHVTGTLFLRNGVALELAKGCVLEGSADPADYPDIRIPYAELREPWQAIVAAVDQTNVAVRGEGEIFGNGRAFPHGARLGRPQGLLFLRCRNVSVEDVFLHDLARWTCYLKECDGCTVRRIRVDSHANANNDGIDIDARNVSVEDCDFDCDDDGIVMKSDNADFVVENVTVRNCRVRSNCSAVKLGTGSHGGFRNILVDGIAADASERQWSDPKTGRGVIAAYRVETWPGSDFTPSLLSGVAIECVDGGLLEDVTVRNVTVARAATPIFIRGGLRLGRMFGNAVPLGLPFGRHARLERVLVENVTAKATSFTASSITGVTGLRLKDIVIRNVSIEVPGAGEAGRAELGKPVPEKAADYPESNMFDARMLPAYGFYVRHADGVRFENVRVRVAGSEVRPEFVRDDAPEPDQPDHAALWNRFLDPPAAYASFKREAVLVAKHSCADFDVEVYLQANGPHTRQRVMVAVPKGLKAKAPCVVVPFYFPEAMLGFDPADGSCRSPHAPKGTNLTYYAGVTYMADLARCGYVTVSADAYHLTYCDGGETEDPMRPGSRWQRAGEALNRDWPAWTGVGKLVFDTRLLVDLTAADPRVDAERIGMIGHSLGGKMAFYAGMTDARVKVVVASDFGLGWTQTNWGDGWYWGGKLGEVRALGLSNVDLLELSGGKPFGLIAGQYDDADSGRLMMSAAGYSPERLLFVRHGTGHFPPREATERGYDFLDRFIGGRARGEK